MTKLITEQLPLVASSTNGVQRLREMILQLAIMGKLVKRDPSDEHANEWLIRVKSKNPKQQNKKSNVEYSAVNAIDYLFTLPVGWVFRRLGQVAEVKSELVAPEQFQNYQQVAPDAIEKGTGKLIARRTVKESGVRSPNHRFYAGQILYSKIRPSLSKAVLVDFEGLCSADMYPLETVLFDRFLLLQILSSSFLQQVKQAENRVKMPKLNQESLLSFVVGVPPLQNNVASSLEWMNSWPCAIGLRHRNQTQNLRTSNWSGQFSKT